MSSTANIIVPASNACSVVSSIERGISLPSGPQQFIVKFPEIKVEHSTFVLHQPVELLLEQVDGGWSCEAFAILAFGATATEAVCSFFEDFSVLWEEIAQAPDNCLSEEAQHTKQALLSAVKSIAKS